MIWSEPAIANALVRQTFQRKYLAVVPNCNWTGYECDLLAVTESLRLVDVEIKISRADLKADAKKDKWWRQEFAGYEDVETDYGGYRRTKYNAIARPWPVKVWKHYYAMPADIWKPELLDVLASSNSGVILLKEGGWPQPPAIAKVVRRATPNKDAKPITAAAAIDIARLASLRMWDALLRCEELVAEINAKREEVAA